MFGYPLSMATLSSGVLFVGDYSNHCVRRVTQQIDTKGNVLSAEVTWSTLLSSRWSILCKRLVHR